MWVIPESLSSCELLGQSSHELSSYKYSPQVAGNRERVISNMLSRSKVMWGLMTGKTGNNNDCITLLRFVWWVWARRWKSKTLNQTSDPYCEWRRWLRVSRLMTFQRCEGRGLMGVKAGLIARCLYFLFANIKPLILLNFVYTVTTVINICQKIMWRLSSICLMQHQTAKRREKAPIFFPSLWGM